MNRVRTLAAGLLLASLGAAPAARAQSASDKAAAETLFDEGKRLMEAKRYPEACPKLADSQRLDPGVGTLLNLALCYKQNGQSASAWSTYREAAAQARAAQQADREQLARDEAAALEKTLTRLTIEVSSEAANTPGLELKRDGAALPASLWGVPTPVDPGVRRVVASAPGKKPLELNVRAEGAGAIAKLVVPPLEDAAAARPPAPAAPPPAVAPPPPPPPAPAEQRDGSGQRTAGFVVGGIGAAGIVTGVIFGLVSMAQSEAADRSEGSERADHRDGAEAKATIAYVSLGVGAAALTTGIVLLATAPPKRTEAPAAALFVTPSFDERELGARLTGRF